MPSDRPYPVRSGIRILIAITQRGDLSVERINFVAPSAVQKHERRAGAGVAIVDLDRADPRSERRFIDGCDWQLFLVFIDRDSRLIGSRFAGILGLICRSACYLFLAAAETVSYIHCSR